MIDPAGEIKYRYGLANEHLGRAERSCEAGDWASCVHYSQLAVENFAKAIIAIYQVPTWSHDPSNQLMNIIDQVPTSVKELVIELARMSRELAAEHSRSTYGEPAAGLTPSMIYDSEAAAKALSMARRAREIAISVFKALGITA